MLSMLLTYHQVLPLFLDFLFPFGHQEYAKDFYFSAFRKDERFTDPNRISPISDVGRSGLDFGLYYNLRSVERTPNPPDWQWSIRQTAAYHSFDLDTGKTVWILVKGKKNMQTRFQKATKPGHASELTSYATVQSAFAASLASHLLLCEWALETWAEYINHMEARFQGITRHAVVAPNQSRSLPVVSFQRPTRSSTAPPAQVTRRSTLISISPSLRLNRARRALTFWGDSGQTHTSSPIELGGTTNASQTENTVDPARFSFDDLVRVQFVEEKANESLLVIRSNIVIMAEMKNYYGQLCQAQQFPDGWRVDASKSVARFTFRVDSAMNEMAMQQSRLETLLRLLAGRKAMVCFNSHTNNLANAI